ncbi:hypothetical protein ACFWF3_25915 [Nocardia sp. NPDC060220]|uniref:hypothetical protein n=1 Tax=Nocardia sp. NPDC060220 TaxID=3347076 RepID=UPI0036531333
MIDNDASTGTGGFGEILVSSRSLHEYRAMFALTDDDLGRRILDCRVGRPDSPPRSVDAAVMSPPAT